MVGNMKVQIEMWSLTKVPTEILENSTEPGIACYNAIERCARISQKQKKNGKQEIKKGGKKK